MDFWCLSGHERSFVGSDDKEKIKICTSDNVLPCEDTTQRIAVEHGPRSDVPAERRIVTGDAVVPAANTFRATV